MIFPLFFAALGTSSFGSAINLPGFPKVDSFLDFSLAGTIVQGVLFGSVQSGSALATDIENGFFYRLMAAPSSRLGILVGRLAGAAAYGAFQTLFFSLLLLLVLAYATGFPNAKFVLLPNIATRYRPSSPQK
jgi:ABC-2 type transport system permease protein